MGCLPPHTRWLGRPEARILAGAPPGNRVRGGRRSRMGLGLGRGQGVATLIGPFISEPLNFMLKL